MILINKVKEYADSLVERITDLKTNYFVVDDSQLANIMRDVTVSDSLILVAFVPSHKTEGKDVDSVQNRDVMLWLVLSKFDKNEGQEAFIEEISRCQLAASEIQKMMLADKVNFSSPCSALKHLEVASIEIDPVWDLFSCLGYEINYSLKTKVY